MISSTDGGITWITSTGIAETGGDEAKIVELNNGNLMMSIRNSGTRRFNISTNKGVSWGTAYNQPNITDPNCDGDFIRYTSTLDGYDKNRLLHTIPFAGNRSNVSVLMSTDEGATWPIRKTIFPGASAYSSLTVLPDGTLGIYYENGESSTYQMYFARFSLNWLSSGTDVFIPNTPGQSAKRTGSLIKINNNSVSSAILNGEDNIDSELNITLEPNPTNDLLKVTINNAKEQVTAKISNLSGKLIRQMTLDNMDTKEVQFSLENQADGIYLLQVSDSKTTISKKVIKK